MIYYKSIRNMIEKTEYIPRKLSANETLKVFHRYYIPDEDRFRCFKFGDI